MRRSPKKGWWLVVGAARWVDWRHAEGRRGVSQVKLTGCEGWFGYEMGKKEVAVQDAPSFLTPRRSEFGALPKKQSWEQDTLFGS